MNFKNRIKNIDINTLEVLKNSWSSLLIKLIGLSAGFALSIYLGRTLGPEGLGLINLSRKIMNIFLILALFGMPPVVLKYVAIGYAKRDNVQIGNTVRKGLIFSGSLAIILSLIVYNFSTYISIFIFNSYALIIPLKVTSLIIVPQVFSRILSSAINGTGKVWQSHLVKDTLSAVLVGILILLSILLELSINVVLVAKIYLVARIFVSLIVFIYWRKLNISSTVKRSQFKEMFKMALPMVLVSSVSVLNSNFDSIMIGFLGDLEQVGFYNVALRLATITSIIHIISASVLSPKIASFWADGKINEIEIMVQRITKLLIILGVITLIIYFFFGTFFLEFWGKSFKESYVILIILCLGQFFNLTTGAAGLILIMTGLEKIASYISITVLCVNIILNIIFIPLYGAIGAALVTSITLFIENIIKYLFVLKKRGISCIKF